MRVNRIVVKDLLSFETFSWDKVDPRLNVIVGPNGAGKTNLFRAVTTAADLLEERASHEEWDFRRHRPVRSRAYSIALDIDLTAPEEQALVWTYVLAATCDSQSFTNFYQPSKAWNPADREEALTHLAFYLAHQAEPQGVDFLYSGTLNVTSRGPYIVDATYEVILNGVRRRLILAGGSADYDLLVEGNSTLPMGWSSATSLFEAWEQSLDDDSRAQLRSFLDGNSQHPPDLNFARIVNANPGWLRLRVDSNDSPRLETHTAFIEALGVPPVLFGSSANRTLNGAFLFHHLLTTRAI